MEEPCEHLEGSPIGKCAICERTVCSECYREVFNTMICDGHEDLEDESDWELVGFYANSAILADRRFALEESGITSLAVESDEDSIELYVPTEEKDDAYLALSSSGEETLVCEDCRVQYSADMGACPLCGVRPVGDEASGLE